MGYTSQAGSVGFATQGSKGVYANPGSAGIFMRTRSGALGGSRDLLIPEPEIGGGRDVADAYLGPAKFAGEYDFYTRLDSLATLIYGALGTKSSASAGSGPTLVGTHTITPVDGNVPLISVEENIANDFDHFRYTDAKVNTFNLEADANGFLMGKAGLIALSCLPVPLASATANPAPDASAMIVGSNITVALGGSATFLPAKSFSLALNNNAEDDDFRLGSLSLGDTTEKRRTLTIGAKIRPTDKAIYRQAMFGTPNATQIGGLVTHNDVTVTCKTYEFIGTTAVQYSVSFYIPQAVVKPFNMNPQGDNILEFDVEIQAVRPVTATPLCTATVVNHLATIL